ncbi:MAG: hypothetical protein JXB00_02160 [Bacteroidales bacterium]|nr:hypothetical protein [Bacteroidales bacterium]
MHFKVFVLFVFLLISVLLKAQPDYRPGYIITLSGDTIHGEIDYRGDYFLGVNCQFKKRGETKTVPYTPGEIHGYRFDNGRYFVSRSVEPGEWLFLEYVVKGKLNLYYHRGKYDDNYYIDKEGFPLKLLPYNEKFVVRDDGTRALFQSKIHVGVLNIYTEDAPEIQNDILEITEPDEQNLIRIAETYHKAVCKDEECIVYGKNTAPIKVSAELAYGFSAFNTGDMIFNEKANELGTFVYVWMPGLNEKFSVKTGLLYNTYHNEYFKYMLKIPTHLYYQYPVYRLKPHCFVGLTSYFVKSKQMNYFWTITGGAGFNLNIIENFSLFSNISADITPVSFHFLFNEPMDVLAYTISLGMRYDF